ncbi:rolling circle replication-associated protein [Viridibacillus arvi]|uniref:rolling circle replication-associated protein n=1 Tax=Viridibacillus arvi TaxID=263475 RepID=UPI0036EBCCF9
MNEILIRLSGMYAEVLIRAALRKAYNRNSGRKSNSSKLCLDLSLSEEDLARKEDVRAHSIANTLRTFKRLLYANFSHGYTFLTLTFDEKSCDFDITDTAICRTKFTNFWKNLKRGSKVGECLEDNVEVRYLGVQEYHRDGSIHFHVLCHIPRQYKALLKKKWQHGNLDFKRSNKDPLEVQKIANYMKKGIFDPRLNNENHRYLASRGLNKPKTFKFTSPSFPTWINESNSELLYKEESEYAFTYYQFITSLTEDEFQSYVESSKEQELQYYIEQLKLIQQLQPAA